MEINQLINIVSGLLVMAITHFVAQHWQSNKTKAELLEKLDISIKNNCKQSACEIFFMIQKVKMNFQGIKTLIEDDNSFNIISVLKRTPGLADYKNGQLRKRTSPRWHILFEKFFVKFNLAHFIIFELFLVLYLPFAKDLQVFVILIEMVGVTIIIMSFLGIQRDYKAVDELVNSAPQNNLGDSS